MEVSDLISIGLILFELLAGKKSTSTKVGSIRGRGEYGFTEPTPQTEANFTSSRDEDEVVHRSRVSRYSSFGAGICTGILLAAIGAVALSHLLGGEEE